MEVIRRSRIGHKPVDRVRKDTKLSFGDTPAPNEGCLVITLNDSNLVNISGVRIYLNTVVASGGRGRAVQLTFIGPTSVKIDRQPRKVAP